MPETSAARLVIGFEGTRPKCKEWATSCATSGKPGPDGLTTMTGASVDSIWNWLSESPALIQINVLPSRLVGVMGATYPKLPAASRQAHAANGVIDIYPPADAVTHLQAMTSPA